MKRFLISTLLVLALHLSQQPVRATKPPPRPITMLIQFTADTTSAERDALLAGSGAQLIEWIEQISVAKVMFAQKPDAEATPKMRHTALASPHITFVEHDAVVQGTYKPNDPDLNDLQKGYGHQIINLPGAWDYEKGNEKIIIAILDSGINTIHTELADKIVGGFDFINNDRNPIDDHGHGSHVSGVIAAEMDNLTGSSGVCPQCSILPIKVLDQDNFGTWSAIIDGIIYATDHNARVINVSLGGETASKAVEAAVEYAQSKGVLIVAAAGNSRSQHSFYPAAYPGVLAVGATDNQDKQWYLSNTGSYIDVSAPGHLIYSTSKSTNDVENSYAYMSGTSMAAPYVSGLAGLLLSQDPTRTPEEITELITSSADDLGKRGWDSAYGHGRINAVRALIFGHVPTFEVESEIYLPVIASQ